MTVVTVLHPGKMGVSVAASFASVGHEVWWVSAGRSPATAERADGAGLHACASLDEACDGSDVVVSVCPPGAAADVARSVVDAGFSGVFVDANAISASTTTAIAAELTGAGLTVVDGSIVGPPAHEHGSTRLFLSGPAAGDTAAMLDGGPLEVRAIDGGIGAASALKMAYAGWTKGSAALLLAVVEFARAAGVDDELVAEWERSQPGLAARAELTAAAVAPKAWRFVVEMEEIAASLADAGVPDGFHAAAAELYATIAAGEAEEETP